ncbi:MAG: glycosyltransferase, partial [Planctomycetes bacterium]|nr:glycosyltransferase [Planctomycetota bacterium]
LEIIVVDACSPQRDGAIARAYADRHDNIRYLRADHRIGTSEAFNLATAMAHGRYLTTANTDDRHHPEFIARMCAVLDAWPEFGLAYANTRITRRDNETWASNSALTRHDWPDFTPGAALSCCLFGAQAVWRRDAHDAVGPWDTGLLRANDQDMFLRIALRFGAVHIAEDLGLFLRRPDSESGRDNRAAALREVLAVMRRYRETTPLEQLFPLLRDQGTGEARAAAWIELGNLAALGPYTDAEFALQCYRNAMTEGGSTIGPVFANNTAAVLLGAGAVEPAARALRLAGDLPAAAANRRALDRLRQGGKVLPMLRELEFAAVDHAVVAAARRTRAVVFDDGGAPRWTPWHQQLAWDVYDGPNGVPLDVVTAPADDLPNWAMPRIDRRRRVLIVMYGWADSGGGTMLPRAVAHGLAASGAEVAVFHAVARKEPGLPAYGVARRREGNVILYGICNRPTDFMDLADPEREIDDPVIRQRFVELLDDWHPDVVHFWNLHNLGMSLPGACRARGIPTVLSTNNYWALCPRLYLISERLERCHGASEDGRKCESCLGVRGKAAGHAERRRQGIRMLREDIDVHLAVSQRVRQLHVANGDDPAHVRVLRQEPPGVTRIWEAAGSRRAIVSSLQRPLRVGYVGSVMAHKGVHVLAAALQGLPRGLVESVALGDVASDYAAVLRRLDPEARLHLCGRYDQQRLPELLGALDVVVVPSVWDDCAPFVVAEAMAARCPVIGSRIGGIPDFIEHGVNGMLFDPGDAAGLLACLRAYLDDRELLGCQQAAIRPPRGLDAFVDDLGLVYDEVCAPRSLV